MKHKFLLSYIKDEEKNETFGNIEIEKAKFYSCKDPSFSKDVNIHKVLLSNKVSTNGKYYKYYIGDKYDYKTRPLYIILPK